ncbi:MAG TPA: NAD-dependent DNA ligase LigA, partial [Phycisphaerae bacterium]|nr:NAD-dependent DNA ligase LigA [Phycisphaerae bacterium]
MTAAEKEIRRLREQIEEHDRSYYVHGRPVISDFEYDKLFARLRELEAAHPDLVTPDSPTQRVGETLLGGFKPVEHAIPILSIDNTYSEGDLRDFDGRVAKALGGETYEYIVDPKIDGVSASLRYETGAFVLGATRGTGRVGDDITANLRTLRSILLRLPGKGWPEVLEVRGEVYWPRAAFDAYNAKLVKAGKEPFANPRNATTGALKSLDPRDTASRGLAFLSHGFGEIAGAEFERASEFFDAIKKWGLPVNPHTRVLGDIEKVIRFVEEWDHKRRTLEYETDGLVIKINNLAQRETLGFTSRFPRWAVAYKYAAEQGESIIHSVDFQVGKLGTITPRANLEPVQLSGTIVKHATLHNFDQVARLDVRIGDTVIVEKAGEIIPQVVRVIIEKRPRGAKEILPPKSCPVCGGDVTRDEGGVYVRCINPACDAQIKERLKYFAARDQMDIESLGEALVEKLVDLGWVHSFADIYALPARRDELIELSFEQQRKTDDGTKTGTVKLGEKRVEKLLEGIEKSKARPLARVLAAMNVRHVGETSAELLADHFGDMEKIAEATMDELQEVDGVGPEMAKSIHTFFNSEAGRAAWQNLRAAGVNMVQKRRAVAAKSPLAGKTVVVTGTLRHFDRKGIETLIKELGGKATGSVSAKTDLLVAGESAGSKLDKAKSLGVKVLTE